MDVCVFLSASEVAERYVADARRFGQLLGEAGCSLVWGGSNVGLMRIVADEVEAAGGRLSGITVDFLAPMARPGADSMVVAASLAERKKRLLEAADAVAVLVGGSGTLDELTDAIELRKHHRIDVPIVVINTDGFYDGLRAQLDRMDGEGFLPRPADELVFFADTPDAAFDYLQRCAATNQRGWTATG